MVQLPESFRRFMAEMELERREALLRQIAADPAKHKLTLVMTEKGASTRYWKAGIDGRGREIRFGYTCWRNAAGYFLSFREVVNKDGTGFRDKFAARKVRKRAAALAQARANRFSEKSA